MIQKRKQELRKEIQELRKLLHEREAALPPHSVRPHQIQEIEGLEGKILALEKELEDMSEG